MAQQTAQVSLSIFIRSVLSVVVTGPVPDANLGQPYNAPLPLLVSGGTPPYVFASNNLPSGLSLSSTGILSGTPTVSGSFNFLVTITDSGN